MNNFYFNILNIVLIIIFLYIIIKNIFFNNLEAFSLKDITKEIDKKVSKVEKKIGKTTKNTIFWLFSCFRRCSQSLQSSLTTDFEGS